jgi:hypothetical protein
MTNAKKENIRASIDFLLSRIQETHRIFGTVTDQTVLMGLSAHGAEINAPEFSERDLKNFRFIVRNGVMKNVWLRPPYGYKVHGFLLELSRIQHKQREAKKAAQNDELVEATCPLWLSQREKSGSWEEAKKSIAQMWGDSEMDTNTRKILNESFTIAKSRWEAGSR